MEYILTHADTSHTQVHAHLHSLPKSTNMHTCADMCIPINTHVHMCAHAQFFHLNHLLTVCLCSYLSIHFSNCMCLDTWLNNFVRKKKGNLQKHSAWPNTCVHTGLVGCIPLLCLPTVSQGGRGLTQGKTESTTFSLLSLLFFLFLKYFLLWVSTHSPQVGSEGPKSCQHFSSSRILVQKASCYPEGCDRWQDHRAERGGLTHVERHQGAGSRALEIIPGLLWLLILTIPHPSNL